MNSFWPERTFVFFSRSDYSDNFTPYLVLFCRPVVDVPNDVRLYFLTCSGGMYLENGACYLGRHAQLEQFI